MPRVLIPTPLRGCTDGRSEVDVDGKTVGAAMAALVADHPRLQGQLYDQNGALRSFVNLFLNDEDVRMLEGTDTTLSANDTIEILPAIAGGAPDHDSPAGEHLETTRTEDFVARKKRLEIEIPQMDVRTLADMNDVEAPLRIDVRGGDEWAEGHLPGAVHIDRGFLEMHVEQKVPDRSRKLVIYCQSGTRSLLAAETLRSLGYRNVASLIGGIKAWKDMGHELVAPARLNDAQKRRYSRHLTIPEIGIEGQKALSEARVLLIGAGGLGCPASIYLAAAGVGHLTIVDDDDIEESNLQRQILYNPDQIGQPKAETARETLTRFNPLISVEAMRIRLDEAGARTLFPDYDVIVDGTDNFSTRYVINDAAVACGKPVVHGAIYRFNGQVSVFGDKGHACYRCFSPEAPPPELAPSCAEGGVLGILPGTIGLVMATEVVKLLLSIGDSLTDRIVHYDALAAKFRELKIQKREDCPVCGNRGVVDTKAQAALSAEGQKAIA